MTELEKIKNEFSALSRLHNSLVEAADNMQEENRKLQSKVTFLETQLANNAKALDINKNIMRQNIEQNNSLKDANSAEIIQLREEIKRLKGDLGIK